MKQLFQSLLLGCFALHGFACASVDDVAAEATAQGAEESAAREAELSAQDVAAEGAAASEQADAPESVELLSPAEREAQLRALTGNVVGPRGQPERGLSRKLLPKP